MCVPAKKRENGTPSVRAATVNLARRQHPGTKKNPHRAGEEQGFPVCMEAFLTRGATMKFRINDNSGRILRTACGFANASVHCDAHRATRNTYPGIPYYEYRYETYIDCCSQNQNRTFITCGRAVLVTTSGFQGLTSNVRYIYSH